MNPLTLLRAGAAVPGAVLDVALGSGRRRRRVWAGRGKAHIEVRGVHRSGMEALARDVERALHAARGVRWAQVNALTGRVVVAFDPDGPSVDDLVGIVEGVEEAHDVEDERFPRERPEHPGDIEPLRRQAVAIGADAIALGASAFGLILRAAPFPVELGSLVALAENEPRVRGLLEHHFGAALTDLGLGVTSAFTQALSQGPLTLVTDITHRANQLGELQAHRRAWERREGDLCDAPVDEPLRAARVPPRERPLRSGPVESYADAAAAVSVAGMGATLAATRSPRLAGGVVTAGVPKAARHGREAFAARLGRELAARDVVVLDRTALRRLDRIDAVVLDAAVLRSGRMLVHHVRVLEGHDATRTTDQARALLDPGDPGRLVRRGRWAVGPLEAIAPEDPHVPEARAGGRAGRLAVGIARSGRLAGVIDLEAEIDPLAQPLADAVRRSGLRLVLAGKGSGLAERIRADEVVAAGTLLARSVRALQAEGLGVLLVSGGPTHGALRAADVGIGVDGRGPHPPWGAAVVTSQSLAHAHLVVESLAAARSVSRWGVGLSAAGFATGATWSMLGLPASASRRAAVPVNVASLAAQVAGTAAAASVGRHPALTPITQMAWHAMSPDAVLRALGTSRRGLPVAEAARRHAALMPRAPARPSVGRAIVAELANPLTPVMLVGAGMAAAVGSVTDAALVAGATAVNALIGGVQRVRADLSIARLLQATTSHVDVRRGDRVVARERSELVPGDLLELKAGDVVPADCRLIETARCEIDESALTGESLPVAKQSLAVEGRALADRSCMAYEGSVVVTGSALGVVVAVGDQTEVGRSLADAPEPPPSGVEARLSSLMKVTVPASVASGAGVVGLSLLRGRSPRAAVTSGVSLTVAAVPEGLPLLATVAQLAAARRLARRGVLVRNPRTIEALGRVDVLCFDKTGTLTAGRIALQSVSDGAEVHKVAELTPRCAYVLAAALRASPISDGEVDLPHATDRAVVEGAQAAGVQAHDGLGSWTLLGELAFEPSRGYHAVVGDSAAGPRVSVKGAPETVLPRCTTWRAPDGPVALDRRVRASLDDEVERLAGQGLRVLAVAERPASSRAALGDERIAGMELLGFLGLADGVRPTAAAAVASLRTAGVSVVMITGDHPSTAASIAEELHILNGADVVTGADVDAWDDASLEAAVAGATVFARVTPEQKMRIVRTYQRMGRAVAMTGDGANDAPAIRLADTGIALGRHGSPAAREAADLVVLDDRIETITDAIVEGRAMWASVRDALAILVGGNLGEVGFVLASTAISGGSPLGARQILLVNLLTDMMPAMTIALRPPPGRSSEELLHEGPEASLGGALARQIALRAATTAAGATGAWLMARPTGSSRRAGTVALVALVGTQLGQTAVVGGTSPLVLASTAASAGVLVAIVQTPVVSHFFGCTPMGPVGWGIALGNAAGATAASVAVPWAARRLSERWTGPRTGRRAEPRTGPHP
ncbi:MAG: HAD-IC family P-type ATPase [Actinomycetota bacterium]|nr:HAD-IC family P-type ATPase [Actinomycetota bacterium]